MANSNCYLCSYLSKRPGAGNYFIYKCSYWGIISQDILPQSVIINSIGKRCEFFVKKQDKKILKKSKKDSSIINSKNADDIDLIV